MNKKLVDIHISPVYRGNLLWDREGLTCIVEKLCNFQAGIMKLFQEYHFDSTVKEVQKRSIRRMTWQQRDFFFFQLCRDNLLYLQEGMET